MHIERYNKKIGKYGEDETAKYLQNNDYKIIDRNYNCRFGELDIVALENDCLVFIEVKTRTTSKYGAPENAVNYWKQNHLKLAARNYIDHKRMGNYIARFDIVEVFAKCADNNFEIEKFKIIKNAF